MQRGSMWRLLVAAALLTSSLTAQAQSWPSKPVRIIVPFPPGGTTDIVARSLGAELQKMWQQPVSRRESSRSRRQRRRRSGSKEPERRLHAADGHRRHARDQCRAVRAERQQDAV